MLPLSILLLENRASEMKKRSQYGVSSIGRVAVSKTVGCGFKSLTPCQLGQSAPVAGGVAEWSIAAVLKTALA